MNGNDERLDALLDRTLEQLRRTEAGDREVASAADRVRSQLAACLADAERERAEDARIQSCDDWQRLIPAYLTGDLSDARRMLLEDHSRECVPCRRALKQAREASTTAAPARRATRRSTASVPGWRRDWTWGAAAAALVVFALIGFGVKFGGFGLETGGLVRVETVDGSLMQVADLVTTPAVAGENYAEGEAFRTARESGAVMTLEDGSRIEMNERSQLSVSRDGRSQTIHLERGDIIVQAAEQGAGRLYVQTADARVEVTGTVFSVSAGTKGSRIAVLQGEVIVEHEGERVSLRPGEQYASSGTIRPVRVDREIAWSRDSEHWMAVAREMEDFQAELDRRVGDVSQRFSSTLLDVAPAGTVVYVALPNLTEVLTEAHGLLLEKVASNETLRAWWDEHVLATGTDAEIERAIGTIGRLGKAIGDEIVVTVQAGDHGDMHGVVVMAEAIDPDSARSEIDALIAQSKASGDADLLRRVDDPAALTGDGPAFWVRGGHVVFASDAGSMQRASLALGASDGATLRGSGFHDRLRSAYRDGVGVLVGADLHTMLRSAGGGAGIDPSLQAIGLGNVRYLLVERSDLGSINRTRATLSVDGEREGVLSWLAEPAPMGGLEFVSPDAMAVTSFVMRRPATLIEDLLTRLGGDGDEARAQLDAFRAETGVDLLADVAGALGGEFTMALDGPILPKPAWKIVVEAYDPEALQRTLAWGVEQLNSMAAAEGEAGVRLTSAKHRGRTYWTIESEATGLAAHYTFVDGYWLIASQTAMIDRALQYRASGITLGTSRKFREALPEDGHQNVSAVMYQDLGRILGSLLGGPVGESLPEEQKDFLRSLVASQDGPTAFVAYGQRDGIQVVGADRGSFLFGNRISQMFNVGTLFDLESTIPDADPSTPDDPDRYDGGGVTLDSRSGA